MGLLDEAIREHLELKRRHGADPGDVARDEHAALDPVFPNESVPIAGDAIADGPRDEVATADDDQIADGEYAASRHGEEVAHGADAGFGEVSSVGQETAEIDMHAVLYEDRENADEASSAVHAAARPTAADASDHAIDHGQSGSFEWAMPDDSERQAPVEQAPGQERMPLE